MEQMKRYAVYYAPPAGEFANRAHAWLGRDPESGADVARPACGFDVAAITGDPRRYGFHATLKAPFRLAAGQSAADLDAALRALAARLAPVQTAGLDLAQIGRFLALIPEGQAAALTALAAEVVRALEPFRAPLSAAELARRHPERLSPRQRDLLEQYGYPFVMEEFRFHLTLTDGSADAAKAQSFLRDWFAPVLPRPFEVAELCLFAEPPEGPFRLLHRYPLTGAGSA